jgi:hypothetical protein
MKTRNGAMLYHDPDHAEPFPFGHEVEGEKEQVIEEYVSK